MKLQELIEAKLGVKTDMRVNPLAATVNDGVVTQLLHNDPNRLAWTLINLGTVQLMVAFTPDPSATKGIYISASGGYAGLNWEEDMEILTWPVWGYCSGANCPLYLVELVAL